MPRPFSDFSSQFFWDFKRMDNVNYNFEIIETLYKGRKDSGNNSHYNKPIIILLVSIIECSLYDFLVRIRFFKNDPLPHMSTASIAYLKKTKDTDELRKIIPCIKSQNILCASKGDLIYDDLEKLRIVRNRLHIQNRYNMLNRDEKNVFTDTELVRAQESFEKVFDILCNVYPRWRNQPIPMIDFPRPWL